MKSKAKLLSVVKRCDTCGFAVEGPNFEGEFGVNTSFAKAHGEICPKLELQAQNAQDRVNHPTHYNQGKIEVIEFIEDQGMGRDFCLANAIKYIARAGKKDPQKYVEDLEKAVWYVRRAIEQTKENPRRPNEMPQERAT